jgi:hypothetical protein
MLKLHAFCIWLTREWGMLVAPTDIFCVVL